MFWVKKILVTQKEGSIFYLSENSHLRSHYKIFVESSGSIIRFTRAVHEKGRKERERRGEVMQCKYPDNLLILLFFSLKIPLSFSGTCYIGRRRTMKSIGSSENIIGHDMHLDFKVSKALETNSVSSGQDVRIRDYY